MNENNKKRQAASSLPLISRKLTECLKASDADMQPEAPFALAAIAYWRKLIALRIMTAEDRDRRVLDDDTRTYLTDFAARYETAIRQAVSEMGVEELQSAIRGMTPDVIERYELPPSKARLVFRMLDVHEGESLLCGGDAFSSFIEEVCGSISGVQLTALEENSSLRRILRIRAAVMGWPLEVLEGDIFSSLPDGFRADKIFLDAAVPHRFGEKRGQLRERLANDSILRAYFPETRLHTLDFTAWATLLTALSKQSPGGKTIVVISKRDLKASRLSACRETLVREGRLEAVVALPEKLDNCRFSEPYLLVSGEERAALRMVDASDVYTSVEPTLPKGAVGFNIRPHKTFTSENIETILERLGRDDKRSRLASPEELATRNFSLLPDVDYLDDKEFYRNLEGTLLSEICKISRGAVASSGKEMKSRFSETPTPFQYLQLKDVQGGILQGPFPYLQSIDKKQIPYCAKNGMLVMGKNVPFRVGVLELPENTQVLLGGNIYAMKVTNPKFDPVYVMAYLQSAEGMRQMNSFLEGETAVQIISKNDLENIKIPKRDINEQRDVAKEYRQLHAKREKLLYEAEQIQKKLDALPGKAKRRTT